MNKTVNSSPCSCCTRVKDPKQCENKQCKLWQKWFLGRWEQIHNYYKVHTAENELKKEGTNMARKRHAGPVRIQQRAAEDPCVKCACPQALCSIPCRLKKAWQEAKGEQI